MDRQSMIDKIYEKIADKTLSFGCKVNYNPTQYIVGNSPGYGYDIYEEFGMPPINQNQSVGGYDGYNDDGIDNGKYKIIGHQVMLGDLLDYFDNKERDEYGSLFEESVEYLDEIENYILGHYNKKRLSIDEQDEELIKYIYNLIK